MDTKVDPVIEDLIKWLKDNLPPDVKEEDIFKRVHKLHKIYEVLVGMAMEEFYNYAKGIEQPQSRDSEEQPQKKKLKVEGREETETTLHEAVDHKLHEMREYIILEEEKRIKTQRLNESRAKLDLKKQQYLMIDSIRLDRCMDLMTRYNRLMSKK